MIEQAALNHLLAQLARSEVGISGLQAQLAAFSGAPEGDRRARDRLCSLIRSVKKEIYRLDGIALCALDAVQQ